MMLTEVCQEIRNWFDRGLQKYSGTVHIENGVVTVDGETPTLQTGQYYRLVGTVFNDGVHRWGFGLQDLTPEADVDATLWEMRVPPDVVELASDIAAWQDKYGRVGSENMSPFSSESFNGYSYSKASGGGSTGGGGSTVDWRSAFASRLNRWRKI